jgi:hypothetical protein
MVHRVRLDLSARLLTIIAALAVPAPALADTELYLYGDGTMDTAPPASGTDTTIALTTVGQVVRWSVPMPPGWLVGGIFEVPSGSLTLRYFGSGTNGQATVTLIENPSSSAACTGGSTSSTGVTRTLDDSLTSGGTATWGTSGNGVGASGGYFCVRLQVQSVTGGGVTLRYDSVSAPASLTVPGDAGTPISPATDGGWDGGPPGIEPYLVGCDCTAGYGGVAGLIGAIAIAAALRRPRRRG